MASCGTKVLASKRDEVSSAKRRYDDGLEKVINTEEQVSKREQKQKETCHGNMSWKHDMET